MSLFCTIGAAAQTYYYNTTKTFTENSYAYQCDVPEWGLVTLYNKENKWTYIDQTYKDGSPLTEEFYNSRELIVEKEEWTKPLCYSIVNNTFSDAEKKRLIGRQLHITLIINPYTGKVMEVNFWFTTTNPFATIPVSVYRKIETELKSKIWFTPATDGKKLNYIKIWWRQELEQPSLQLDNKITLPKR